MLLPSHLLSLYPQHFVLTFLQRFPTNTHSQCSQLTCGWNYRINLLKGKKKKDPGIPNLFPFKEGLIRKEEERRAREEVPHQITLRPPLLIGHVVCVRACVRACVRVGECVEYPCPAVVTSTD
jgi:hypothetical protein